MHDTPALRLPERNKSHNPTCAPFFTVQPPRLGSECPGQDSGGGGEHLNTPGLPCRTEDLLARQHRLERCKKRRSRFDLASVDEIAESGAVGEIPDEALGVYGAVDCGAYVANFLLAAASLGVATIPQAALAARPQRIRDFFGLPSDRLVVCGISLGYADSGHPANGFRTSRADIATAVQWEGRV